MTLESDIQDILRLRNKGSSFKSEASEKFKQLQEKINSGESTGDKITDFVIANLGSFSPKDEKPYRKTEAKFRDAAGSQVLIVKQDKGDYMGVIGQGCSKPSLTIIDETLTLGILKSGLKLDIQKGEIIFPTDKHVIKRGNYSNNKWGLTEGPISLNCYEFTYLRNYVKTGILMPPQVIITMDNPNFNHGLMFYLGKEVEKYFERENYLGMGRTLLDISYVEALNLLGHEAPKRFKEKYDKKVYQTNVGIINKLEELTLREDKLNCEIKKINDNIKNKGVALDDLDGGKVRHIYKDEIGIFSGKERSKLNKTREEIQTYLRQSIELRMHKEDLTIKKKPGIEINVPDYIKGMCEKYKVDIPK